LKISLITSTTHAKSLPITTKRSTKREKLLRLSDNVDADEDDCEAAYAESNCFCLCENFAVVKVNTLTNASIVGQATRYFLSV